MCGFGGILNSKDLINEYTISEIAKYVSFRGPDHTGISIYDEHFNSAKVGAHAFFFNRLAILDLDHRSNQPFQNDRYTLLFNGEIYNYKEIKKELESKGITFKTTSDTEVLFYALQIFGEQALSKLNGMFAFFWLDRKEKQFIIARDRVGIKPLYYKFEKQSLVFASELNSVVRLSSQKPRLDPFSVQGYLYLQYVPTPYSIVKDIFKLPPGHYIKGSIESIENNRCLVSQPYWDAYEVIKLNNKIIENTTGLEEIIVRSVERQLQSDVPLGFFLSSGVDSSLLTAVVNKYFAKDRSFDFFTVAFDEKTVSDESSDASVYVDGFKNENLHLHKLSVNADYIASKIDNLYDYYDEPFGDHAALLNWVISQKARQHVTVVLSGDGADELFWGYPRYNQWFMQQKQMLRKIPLIKQGSKLLAVLPPSRIKYALIAMLESNPLEMHFNILRPKMFGYIKSITENKKMWCLSGLGQLVSRDDLVETLDIKTYLADAMLYKVDRASMAASLEVRVPYLDNDVVDYALTLPLRLKSTDQYKNKAPLKQILNKLAPHYNVNKPKKGFNFPHSEWVRSRWKDKILSTITKESLNEVGLDAAPILHILDQHYHKSKNHTIEVWYIFNLILWHNKFKTIKILC